MASDTTKSASKSLSDKDIATFARRAGPSTGEAGTDVDTHAHTDSDDAPAAATDHDTQVATDSDA